MFDELFENSNNLFSTFRSGYYASQEGIAYETSELKQALVLRQQNFKRCDLRSSDISQLSDYFGNTSNLSDENSKLTYNLKGAKINDESVSFLLKNYRYDLLSQLDLSENRPIKDLDLVSFAWIAGCKDTKVGGRVIRFPDLTHLIPNCITSAEQAAYLINHKMRKVLSQKTVASSCFENMSVDFRGNTISEHFQLNPDVCWGEIKIRPDWRDKNYQAWEQAYETISRKLDEVISHLKNGSKADQINGSKADQIDELAACVTNLLFKIILSHDCEALKEALKEFKLPGSTPVEGICSYNDIKYLITIISNAIEKNRKDILEITRSTSISQSPFRNILSPTQNVVSPENQQMQKSLISRVGSLRQALQSAGSPLIFAQTSQQDTSIIATPDCIDAPLIIDAKNTPQ